MLFQRHEDAGAKSKSGATKTRATCTGEGVVLIEGDRNGVQEAKKGETIKQRGAEGDEK